MNPINVKWLTFFSGVIFLNILCSLAGALEWKDPSWKQSGCPDSLMGIWLPISHSSLAQGPMVIKKQSILLTSEKEEHELFFRGKPFPSEKTFVELEILGQEQSSLPFRWLKMRPHLVTPKGPTTTDCLIKVFRYKNRKAALTDRYTSWDIYIRKNEPDHETQK